MTVRWDWLVISAVCLVCMVKKEPGSVSTAAAAEHKSKKTAVELGSKHK